MVKRILSLLLLATTIVSASAQSVAVVDSEKIFRSLSDYTSALAQIEEYTADCQAAVESRFADVERLFNVYSIARASYSESKRRDAEAEILAKEKEATEFQEGCFADNGSIMKLRVKLIEPIQKRVFAAIESYAKSNNIDLVIDKSANPTLLYSGSGVDHTDKIIQKLK